VLCLDAANTRSYPGTGTTWNDLSGNGYDGTLVNGVGYSSDNLGYLIQDGVNDYVQGTAFDATFSEITIMVWLNRRGNNGFYAGILFNSNSRTGMNFYNTTNQIGYHWNNDTGTYSWQSGLIPPLNEWCLSAIVITSTQRTAYLKGNNFDSSSTSARTHAEISGNFRFNTADTTANRYPIIDISIASIYNRALTAQEVQQNFNAMRGRYGI
jgi:hypothetical protein